MQKGDKVKVLPDKKRGIVDRVEDGFIFLEGSNRPYMRGQLDYVKSIYDEAIEKVDWVFSNSEIPNYELRSICVALERAKKVEEFIQSIVDDEDTPVWMKVHINNYIEEELK